MYSPGPTANVEADDFPFNQDTLYAMANCGVEEGGKGADLIVFAPAALKAATRLTFSAVKRANDMPLDAPKQSAAGASRIDAPLCSTIGITRGGYPSKPFGGTEVPVPGRKTELYLGQPGKLRTWMKYWMGRKRERGQGLSAEFLKFATSLGVSP